MPAVSSSFLGNHDKARRLAERTVALQPQLSLLQAEILVQKLAAADEGETLDNLAVPPT